MEPGDVKIKMLIFSFILLTGMAGFTAVCPASDLETEKTMLMFVGEDDDVLSIASGREEAAWQAPGVASVIDRERIRQETGFSLLELLDSVPGFYCKKTETGSGYYLRGIPDSALFLYDTVPMDSVDKVSLHGVKRIEVVRGPGSVLWGQDAFAGIINVVPMTGKELQGGESGLIFSSKSSETGAYTNYGWKDQKWDGFISISGSRTESMDFQSDITRFWGDQTRPVSPEERTGSQSSENGQAVEMTGNFSFKDILTFSGRFSDSRTPYSLSSPGESDFLDPFDDIRWKEVENKRTGFIKVEGNKEFGIDSVLRITGSASMVESEKMIIDRELDQDEYNTYAEMIYETALGHKNSLLTTGISFRSVTNRGVPLWDSYLPDYLVDENLVFLPDFEQNSYTTNLFSFFAQYRKTIGDIDFFLGIRNDAHDSFEDHISYNGGIIWSPEEDWVLKLLTGTAYRTPSVRQLYGGDINELEEIKSLSLELSRKFNKNGRISVCGFLNKIDNHTMDDPYAGLSNPNSQEIRGIELEFLLNPVKWVSLSAGLTIMDNSGPNETYLYNDYSYLGPDGEIIDHYENLEYPYDLGPDRMFHIRADWFPEEKISLFSKIRYFSGYALTYPHAVESEESESVWLADIGVTVKRFIWENARLTLNIKNLFDREYSTPGVYNLEEGDPLTLEVLLRITW